MKQLLVGLLFLVSVFSLAANPSSDSILEIDQLRLLALENLKTNPQNPFAPFKICKQIDEKISGLSTGTYPLDSKYLFYCEEALPVIDHLLSFIGTKGGKQHFIAAQMSFLEEALLVCYQFYQKTKESKYLEKAFDIIEKQKFPSLQLNANLSDSLFTNMRNLEGQMLALRDSIRLEDTQVRRKRMDILRQRLSNLHDAIRTAHPEYAAFLELRKLVKLKDFQSTLNSGEVVIEYFLGHQAIYGFVIRSDDFALVRVPIANRIAINQKISTYLAGLKEPGLYKKMIVEAHRLYQLLLEPFNKYLSGVEKITIIPDINLQTIPFEPLLKSLPKKRNSDYSKLDYLIHHYRFTYNRSATQMAIHRSQSSIKRTVPSIVAIAPGFDQHLHQHFNVYPKYQKDQHYLALDSLAHLTKNLDWLNTQLNATTYKWEQATISNFKEHLQDDILHLGTHIYFDPDYLMQSRIMLAKELDASGNLSNGYISLQDLHDLQMEMEFAVLAGCASGKDGFGFAYGFESAGISSTLYSLWKINEKESAQIIQLFYQHLRTGIPKDEALHLAKKDFIKSAKDLLKPPKYWAVFVLNGDTSPFYFDTPKAGKSYPYIGSFGVLLLFFLYFIWKKRKSSVE